MPKGTESGPLNHSDPADAREAPDLVFRRLRWRCRRGLLELDLVLEAFLTEEIRDLGTVALLERLLRYPDDHLRRWLQGEGEPEDEALRGLIAQLRVAGRVSPDSGYS